MSHRLERVRADTREAVESVAGSERVWNPCTGPRTGQRCCLSAQLEPSARPRCMLSSQVTRGQDGREETKPRAPPQPAAGCRRRVQVLLSRPRPRCFRPRWTRDPCAHQTRAREGSARCLEVLQGFCTRAEVRCHQEPVAVAMLAVKTQPVHGSDCSLVAGSPMDRCLKASDRRRRSNKRPKHTSSLLPAQASQAPPDWTTAGGRRRHPNMLFQLSFSFLTHLVKMLEEAGPFWL